MPALVQLPLTEYNDMVAKIDSLKKQLAARESIAEQLWNETGENLDLKKLLKDLLDFEFPRGSWRKHPSPQGVVLWSRVEKAVRGEQQ